MCRRLPDKVKITLVCKPQTLEEYCRSVPLMNLYGRTLNIILIPTKYKRGITMTKWNLYLIKINCISILSVQFSLVTQSCLTLCDPINRGTPGLPVHHQLQEFTQTHVHQVGDAIQPSHLLSSPSPPAPNPSQHQGVFQ